MLADLPKAAPLVEPAGRIVGLDVNGESPAARGGLGEEVVEESAADPGAAELGEESDVHEADLALAAVDVEPAGGLAVGEHDVERRAGVALAVPGVLRRELPFEELPLLGLIPGGQGELLLADAGVDPEEVISILGGDRTEGDRAAAQGRCLLRRAGDREGSPAGQVPTGYVSNEISTDISLTGATRARSASARSVSKTPGLKPRR